MLGSISPNILVMLCVAGVFALFTFNLIVKTTTSGLTHHVGPAAKSPSPISVNYHFTRKCNKVCKFCFHTAKTSHIARREDMERALRLLKDAGMRKLNFAGGEPFLYPDVLSNLCRFAKTELRLESVSIISNGSKITEEWLNENAQYVDILGVSCDSFDEETNKAIGRGDGENVARLRLIRSWCKNLGIKFKLNTVVCQLNWEEDMAAIVEELGPDRWKCFQVLLVEDENDAAESNVQLNKRKRNARKLLITDEQYKCFCDKHKNVPHFVPESNELMASSYLILDEYLCFLDKGSGKEKQSRSILDVGVSEALKEVRWDEKSFFDRGGVYDWSSEVSDRRCGSELPKDLQF